MPILSSGEIALMRDILIELMTATAEHRNNPTGAASTSSVATGIAITPLVPASAAPSQDYPIEKLFLLRETYTAYTAFRHGDFLITGGLTYAVQAALKTEASLGVFYHLILEERAIDG
jgi:hypothetical protein